MDGGGGGNNGSADEGLGVNVEKTYARILAQREARIAEEVLREKRAMMLTRHFLKTSEEAAQEKRAKEIEKSKRDYEHSMEKLKSAAHAQMMLQQMVREERSQIFELMQDKGRQRADEEQRTRLQKAQREKWLQGRMLYEQLQSDKRQRSLEEREREKLDKLKERQEKYNSQIRQHVTEKGQELTEAHDKRQAMLTKVAEKRKNEAKAKFQERQESASVCEQRLSEAEQRRQQRSEEAAKAMRTASERREQKVAEQRVKEQRAMEEKAKRLAEQALHQASQQQPAKAAQADRGRTPRQEDGSNHELRHERGAEAEDAPEHEDTRPSPRVTSWSKELVDANSRAQKDYVRKCADLVQAEEKALRTKKYKALAEVAKASEEKRNDPVSARLRSLHNMYIARPPREARSESPRSPNSPLTSARRTPLRSARTVQPCGMCEREFPADSLVGSAMNRTVLRFRSQAQGLPPMGLRKKGGGRWAHERRSVFGTQTTALATVALEQLANSVAAEEDRASALYDYEVKLCASCWHFIRAAAT